MAFFDEVNTQISHDLQPSAGPAPWYGKPAVVGAVEGAAGLMLFAAIIAGGWRLRRALRKALAPQPVHPRRRPKKRRVNKRVILAVQKSNAKLGRPAPPPAA
ncbi:MAG: hypothetical protein NW215_00385 [Hyphomicrobiales bacterium]|nr:hypothetical protein [Hyphomicrobiales bacterium]